MVQGNWERRAEMSEARRLEAKQRKQRQGERKVFKAQASDLMSFLNRNADQLFRRRNSTSWQIDLTIHIWTDTPPRLEDGSVLQDELWEEDHEKVKKNRKYDNSNKTSGRRGRSTSFDDDSSRSAKNKKNAQRKKKHHPRSKESSNTIDGDSGETTEKESYNKPKLCRSHFFFGKCCDGTQKNKGTGGKKSYACRFAHYPKNHLTITDVLLPAGSCEGDQDPSISMAKENIVSSEKYFPTFTSVDKTPVADAMDMVYHSSFCTNQLFTSLPDDEELLSPSISHFIVNAMAKQSCNIGSIVYFAIGNQLLYDRYREGIVIEESQLALLGRTNKPINRNRKEDHGIDSMPLSASILEHILSFLDDSAVASMSSVSHSWHREIGKQSANLWRHLLQRRSWPIPSTDEGHNKESLSKLRQSFTSHYTAVRDTNGIKKGIECLLYKKSMNEFDGGIRSFESYRNSAQENTCMAVKIWAANSFLAAYRQDCSLRLFDTVEGSDSSGERLCRELIYFCVDPYNKTKKRNCQLVAAGLDNEFIGCLLHMVDDVSGEQNYILTVMSRETFLINDHANDNAMQVVDIRECVLNYLMNFDDADHGLLQLYDFLSNDGDLDDVEVFVSQSLAECGCGRFIIEASIAIPSTYSMDDQDSVDSFILRKFFLFSTSVGAMTWMADSLPPMTHLRSLNEEMTLSSSKIEENGRVHYEIVSLTYTSPKITSLSVDPDGFVHPPTFIEGTDAVRNEILAERWSLRRARKRPVLILNEEVIVADNLVCDENGERKTVMTFYPMNINSGRSTLTNLDLLGNLEVCHLIALRNAHVIAICRVFESTPETDDVDELAGHWFGPHFSTAVSVYAIVIDVQSRSEIYRSSFVDNLDLHLGKNSMGLHPNDGELPIRLAAKGDTVVAGLSSKGVVMAGADARKARTNAALGSEELPSPKSVKKMKKKKISKKSGKKDGFARGQKM